MFGEYRPEDLKRVKEIELEILIEFIRICEKHDLKYFAYGGTAIGAVRHKGFIPWDDDVDVAMVRDEYEKFISIAMKELGEEYELTAGNIQMDCSAVFARISKKGTLHITEQENRWKRKHGIRIDIFPMDFVPEDKQEFKKMISKVRFWRGLYIIKNIRNPLFENGGWKDKAVRTACFIMHYLLKLVPVKFIVKKMMDSYRAYEGKSTLVDCLDDNYPEKWVCSLDDIYPLQKGEFEGVSISLMHRNHEMLVKGYGDYMELPPESERENHYQGFLEF